MNKIEHTAEDFDPKKQYRCRACGDIFDFGWTEEEALEERDANGWADIHCGIVCDDCYTAMGFKSMREWLVIDDSRKNAVFAPEDSKAPKGFIPRDVAERVLGRRLDGTQWFTREESDLMRAQPEWTTDLDALDKP